MSSHLRVTKRRRSSLAIGVGRVHPGNYGISSPTPKAVTFAPNVTPGTYVDDGEDDDTEPVSPEHALFPPSLIAQPSTSRRREPPGKRRSQGYIPRPPNAFMLFRADFVRQKHVPGSIENTHGTLSKIIGNCWHELPLEEKKYWQTLAKKAKAEHKLTYPDYRFRPVHKKEKNKRARKAEKPTVSPEEEERNNHVSASLMAGRKGADLVRDVQQYDMMYSRSTATPDSQYGAPAQIHAPQPVYPPRRSSSVPPSLYNPITLPAPPFFAAAVGGSRVPSPVGNISRSQRTFLGQRRASSAQPTRSWTMPMSFPTEGTPEAWQLQRDWEPLPAVNAGLFEPTFDFGASAAPVPAPAPAPQDAVDMFNFTAFSNSFVQGGVPPQHDLSLSISPLDSVPQHVSPYTDISPSSAVFTYSAAPTLDTEPYWMPDSSPSSAGSPAQSDASLPMMGAPHQPMPYAAIPSHQTQAVVDWHAADVSQQQMHDAAPDEQAYVQALQMQMCSDMGMPYDQVMYGQPGMTYMSDAYQYGSAVAPLEGY